MIKWLNHGIDLKLFTDNTCFAVEIVGQCRDFLLKLYIHDTGICQYVCCNMGNQTDQSDLRICDSYDLIEITKPIFCILYLEYLLVDGSLGNCQHHASHLLEEITCPADEEYKSSQLIDRHLYM